MWYKFLLNPFIPTILLRFPVRQRIRLSEEVRHELVVVCDTLGGEGYGGLGTTETYEI